MARLATRIALGLGCSLSVIALAGCSGANPVAAQANVAENGLTKGNDAQVTQALNAANQAVAVWATEHGTIPTAADFMTIQGAASAAGATITYQAAGAGYCLTATSSGRPQVVRVLKEPGGLQPAGAHC